MHERHVCGVGEALAAVGRSKVFAEHAVSACLVVVHLQAQAGMNVQRAAFATCLSMHTQVYETFPSASDLVILRALPALIPFLMLAHCVCVHRRLKGSTLLPQQPA